MNNNYITVAGTDAVHIASTAEARATRTGLLAEIKSIAVVNDQSSAEMSGHCLKDVNAFLRLVEATRKAVKQPFLEKGKEIDALAAELTHHLEAEEARLSRLRGGYQAEMNRLAEEAHRQAWQEEKRIKHAAFEKIRAAEEQSRTQTEAERKIAKIEEETTQAIIETRVAAAEVAPPKQEGIATRKDVEFNVEDVQSLYEACPGLVNLVPNRAAIKTALKSLPQGKELPGVKHWFVYNSVTRT